LWKSDPPALGSAVLFFDRHLSARSFLLREVEVELDALAEFVLEADVAA
jgi:hypothetical protein